MSLFIPCSGVVPWSWISRDSQTLLFKNWCSEARMDVLSHWMEPWQVSACSARAESFFLFSNTAFWCWINKMNACHYGCLYNYNFTALEMSYKKYTTDVNRKWFYAYFTNWVICIVLKMYYFILSEEVIGEYFVL